MNSQAVEGLPHDIHGLIPYQPTLLDRWPWILAAGLGLLLVGLVWSWWRTRRRRQPAEQPFDPWDQLEQRLARLEPGELFDSRARETFFYDLSLGLREAIERRTGLRATDMTLGELRGPLLTKLPLPPPDIEAVLDFLKHADFVKFAEAPATRNEACEASKSVQAWVRQLRPRADLALAATASAPARADTPSELAWPLERAGIFNDLNENASTKRSSAPESFTAKRGVP